MNKQFGLNSGSLFLIKMLCLFPEDSALNIQKLFTNNEDIIVKYTSKYILVKKNGDRFLCQVFPFVYGRGHDYINTSVSVKNLGDNTVSEPVNVKGPTDILVQDIEELPQTIKSSKELSVSIVFHKVGLCLHWKKNASSLQTIVRDILRLFVFTSNCTVFLHNLRECQKSDIFCIIINNSPSEDSKQLYKATPSTVINVTKCVSLCKFRALQKANSPLRKLGGVGVISKKLEEYLIISSIPNISNLKFSKQILLSGPSGCGKTTLVRQLAQNHGLVLIEIQGTDVIRSLPGETEQELQKHFNKAKLHASLGENCLLLIDEIDSITSNTGHGRRFLSVLCNLLEETCYQPRILLIATCSRPELLDSKLFRPNHLGDEVIIRFPDQKERQEIINDLFDSEQIKLSEHAVEKIGTWTNGYVGADLSLLWKNFKIMLMKEKVNNLLSEDQILLYVKKCTMNMSPSSIRSSIGIITKKLNNLSDIGGLADVKQRLRSSLILPLLHPEQFRKFNLPVPKGVLLYGPPGCAKTTIVKALANETNMTFIAVSAAELYSPYVGDAEKKISQLFNQARLCSPSILFIDEIDALVGTRSSTEHHKVQERVLSTLLVEMDGIGVSAPGRSFNSDTSENVWDSPNVVIVAATNRPDMVDDALKRPGRFDQLLYVPPPNSVDRLDILKLLTSRMSLDKSVSLPDLVDKTELFSGADLKTLCMEAALHVLTNSGMQADTVTQTDFEFVLKSFKPSLVAKQVASYNKSII